MSSLTANPCVRVTPRVKWTLDDAQTAMETDKLFVNNSNERPAAAVCCHLLC